MRRRSPADWTTIQALTSSDTMLPIGPNLDEIGTVQYGDGDGFQTLIHARQWLVSRRNELAPHIL